MSKDLIYIKYLLKPHFDIDLFKNKYGMSDNGVKTFITKK